MKKLAKALLPRPVVRAYQRWVRSQESRRNENRTSAEVFSEIYTQGKWGRHGEFCSGSGTATESVSVPYVAAMRKFLESYGDRKPVVVDLGCGDFSIGRQLVDLCAEYIGVDVVEPLVAHLQENAPSNCRFTCLDITAEELPVGEICVVRQVLQHLSNRQIAAVLPKLARFSAVLITEHYPSDRRDIIPNTDKVHGSGIRLYDNSGVYLDEPPFNVPSSRLKVFLEVPGHSFDGLYEPGVIRTILYTPR